MQEPQRKANPDNMARMLSDSHRKMQNANLSHLPTTLALSMFPTKQFYRTFGQLNVYEF